MEDKKEMLELGEKMVSSKEVYDGKLLHVYKDMVVLPNGRETARELIRTILYSREKPLAAAA